MDDFYLWQDLTPEELDKVLKAQGRFALFALPFAIAALVALWWLLPPEAPHTAAPVHVEIMP